MDRLIHASLFAIICVAAWAYASTKPAHRVIAVFFAWVLFADLARLWLDPLLDAAELPYEGGALGLYYADHALVLSFRFALLAACWSHFGGGSLRLPLWSFGLTFVVVVVLKEATGISLVPVHHAVAGIVLAACWILVMRAILAPASRLKAPDGAHAVLLVILALMLVKVTLHYVGPIEDTWTEVRRADVLVHGAIALGYVSVLVRKGVRRWRVSRS